MGPGKIVYFGLGYSFDKDVAKLESRQRPVIAMCVLPYNVAGG